MPAVSTLSAVVHQDVGSPLRRGEFAGLIGIDADRNHIEFLAGGPFDVANGVGHLVEHEIAELGALQVPDLQQDRTLPGEEITKGDRVSIVIGEDRVEGKLDVEILLNLDTFEFVRDTGVSLTVHDPAERMECDRDHGGENDPGESH